MAILRTRLRTRLRIMAVLSLTGLVTAGVVGPAPGLSAAPPAPRFLTPLLVDTGTSPTLAPGVSLSVGDFNADGTDDIAVPSVNRTGSVVLLGAGNGQFSAPVLTALPAHGSVAASTVADFNGDGKADLFAAIVSDTGQTGRVLLGKGTGAFLLGQQFAPAGVRVTRVASGDVNGDGRVDIAFVGQDNVHGGSVYVALGRGNGTFAAPTAYPPAVYLSVADLDLVDLNGDSRLDLVYLAGCPTARLGTGNGGFGPALCSTDPQGRLSGVAQVVADLTGDGLPDIAVVDASGGHLSIGRGDGTGRFSFLRRLSGVGNQVNSVTVGDFTGDGQPDLVASADAAPAGPTGVSGLFRGLGAGRFAQPVRYLTGGDGLAPIRLDADAWLDLVSAGLQDGRVTATRNDGRGRFHAPRAYVGKVAGDVPGLVRTADVNGDGLSDVVTSVFALIVVRLRTPGGVLMAPKFSPATDEILSLDLADVDGDGTLDAVTGTFASANIAVLRGRGDGTFAAPTSYGNGSGAAVQGVAVGDVTADGVPDIVSNTFTTLSVLPGAGDGTFGPPRLSGQGYGAQIATLLGDVTGDGRTDAVSVTWSGTADNALTTVRINRGRGDGTFAVGAASNADTNPHDAELADLNGDSRPEVVVSGLAGSHTGRTGLFTFANAGGTLSSPIYYPVPGFGLTVADLDGDGDRDLATTGFSRLAVLTGSGAGAFTVTSTLPAGSQAIGLASADIVGSGQTDLVELDETNPEQVVVHENLSG